jgi:hypothetical protein
VPKRERKNSFSGKLKKRKEILAKEEKIWMTKANPSWVFGFRFFAMIPQKNRLNMPGKC